MIEDGAWTRWYSNMLGCIQLKPGVKKMTCCLFNTVYVNFCLQLYVLVLSYFSHSKAEQVLCADLAQWITENPLLLSDFIWTLQGKNSPWWTAVLTATDWSIKSQKANKAAGQLSSAGDTTS